MEYYVRINKTSCLVAGTLTSNITGGVSCPGDVISLTCTHNPPEDFLRWRVLRSGQSIATAIFNFPASQPGDEHPLLTNEEISGTSTLISTSPTVVSTLTLTATTLLDGAIVECAGSMATTSKELSSFLWPVKCYLGYLIEVYAFTFPS